MKKILLMGIAFLTFFVSVCGCGNKDNKGNNENKPSMGPFELKEGSLEDRLITDSIKLSKTTFTSTDDKTSYYTEITNTSDKDVNINELHIIIKNAEGYEIIEFVTMIGNLAAGETKQAEISVSYKLEGFATIEYKVV